MEFCSKYGYNYGFGGSESEEYSDEDEKTKQKIKKKIRKADTNIIAVKFDQLVASNEMFAGEPKHCKKCTAILSIISEKNIKKEDNKFIWNCEFCNEINDMSNLIDDVNEIPKKDDVTFMLELPKQIDKDETKTKSSKVVSTDDNYLAFCIDVSGSMDTQILIKDSSQQTCSRLNGVKAACVETLKKLRDEEPNKRVALTAFADAVAYYGDCTNIQNNNPILTIGGSYCGAYSYNNFYQMPPMQQIQVRSSRPGVFQRIRNYVTSRNNKSDSDDDQQTNNNNQQQNDEIVSNPNDLENKERILTFANNVNGDIKGIAQSYNSIDNRIRALRTAGSTALGPALLFSIGFASKKPGSSIILCTDGCANVGLGSVETHSDPKTEKFYDDIADYAKQKGVVVNVISMEGTDCKLALLGRVADKSNGVMNIVNPLNLGDEFKSIIGNRIIATNVSAKLIVNHKYLYIRDDKLEAEESKAINEGNEKAKDELENKKKSVINRDIGNANIDTEITFEYGIRKLKDSKETFEKLPFQLQITYTGQDGTKAVRVYTKVLEFTTKRDKAEKNLISEDIIYAHNAQMMSNQVLTNNVVASKYRGYAVQQLQNRNQFIAPEMYNVYSNQVQLFPKCQMAYNMDDFSANEVYKNAKITRSKIVKKK